MDPMTRLTLRLVAAALAGIACTALAPPPTGTLTIHITNVRNAKGEVLVEVCPKAKFLQDDCPFSGSAPAQIGTTVVTVPGIPADDYAVQAFHDENRNRRVDRVLFGIPKEGVGFSNDAPIRMSPPKWNDAVVRFGGDQTIQFKMRYFLGGSGPGAH
jgi:uncharacterized protein (DUF2141 family)